MKIRIISVICLISILLFAGWAGITSLKVNNTETSNEKQDMDSPSEGMTFSMKLPGWNTYKGNCVITDGENLPYLEEFAIEGDVLTFYGDHYIMLDPSMDTIILPTASGWKIDLNAMNAKWRIDEGHVVLLPDDDKPPVICIYDQESGQIQSYLQQKFIDRGIASFELDEFDVYFKDDIIQKTEQVKNIWNYSISDDVFQPAALLLDGDWGYYTLSLVYNNCVALQYEVNFAVCDDFLYMENQISGQVIRVPISLIEA